jgi:hypothetical protein
MRFGALLVSALWACGMLRGADDRAAVPADLLDRARDANEQLYSDLESFVCNEQIVRYKGTLDASTGRQIDTVTARVSFENGEEHYTVVRQNHRPRAGISGLPGAWSEGEFGTLLRQTQVLLTTQPVTFLRNGEVDGSSAALYRFDVSEADSPWDLEVAGQHYRVPFWTEVWVSRDSAQIMKIARTSTTLSSASHISEIHWSVTLAAVEMNGRSWLLPRSGEYSVTYQESGQREWNLMRFSDYHRYGSQAELRFDRVK